MSSVALLLGGLTITWPGVFGTLGVFSAICLTLGLWLRRDHRAGELGIFFPAAVLFALVLGRIAHWYSHPLMYVRFTGALTNLLEGGFSLWGAAIGVLLAALLCAGAGAVSDFADLMDAMCPGAALGIAVGRLGSFFDLSDRGKFALETPSLHRMPFSVLTEVSGASEWRFATFFAQSIFAAVIAVGLGLAYILISRRREIPGAEDERGKVAALFFVFYGASQIMLDSTRYDADFLRSNGFIHIPQILSALALAGGIVWLGIRVIRRKRRRGLPVICWVMTLFAMGGCGGMEYMVQRLADRYVFCYNIMGICLFMACMAGVILADALYPFEEEFETGEEPQEEGNRDLTTDEGAIIMESRNNSANG